MNELIRLARLISKKGSKKIPLFDPKGEDNDSRLEQLLFSSLQSGNFKNDMEASEYLYGTNPSDYRYRMLKSRVRQKMFNHLYFLEHENDGVNRAIDERGECTKLLHFSHVLLLEGEIDLAEKVVQKSCQTCKSLDYYDLLLLAKTIQKSVYAIQSKPKLFNKCIGEIKTLRERNLLEDEAFDLFLENIILLGKSFRSLSRYRKKIEKSILELQKQYKNIHSYNIFELYYRLAVKYYLSVSDFEAIIELCNSVKSGHPDIINPRRFDFHENDYLLIYSYFKLNRYNEVTDHIHQLDISADKHIEHFFKFQKINFLANVHSGNYRNAKEILNLVSKYIPKNNLPGFYLLEWQIYGRCLSLVVKMDDPLINCYQKLNKTSRDQQLPFELAFQSGVFDIMNYINNNMLDLAAEEIRSLVSLVNKGRDGISCYRMNTFLKLLLLLKKCNFDISVCRKKGRYLHRKLKSDKRCKFGTENFEVLPYEKIWEQIIDGEKEKRSFFEAETERYN